jgi:inner membrane protein
VNPTQERIVVSDKIEHLKRGIFDIPIYKADLTIEGEYAIPMDLSSRWKNEVWNENDQTLTFETKQTAAISEFSFELDGKPRKLRRAADGLVLSFKDAGLKPGQQFHFKLQAKLNGYGGLDIAAVADEFEVSLISAWPHPSFHGQLPMEKDIRNDGFSAKWKIVQPSIDQKITVDYIEPVNVYSQGARALKYGFLITLLCLSVLFLMETLGRISIHGMQYLLMTLPLTSFYVLLIALAEHIGFSVSYAIATGAVIGLIFIYFRGIGASRKQSFGLSGILTSVYSLVLTILSSEDYALLIGAISLFVCLAAFLIMTRKLDWSKDLGSKQMESAHA